MKMPFSSFVTMSPLTIVFGSLFVVIIPFVVWASYSELDQISHAQGQVIASAKTQEIQSAIDGVVENIYVKEGQHVKKGEKIITLERSQVQAAFDESRSKVAALQASLSRLRAEVYGTSLEFPPLVREYPEFVANQTELFHRRQQAMNGDIAALNESLKLSQRELDLSLPLLKHGDIGAIEIIRLRRQIADIKGQIANKRNKYFQDSQTEMTKAEEDLSTREQELADRTVTLDRTQIVASMDVLVKNIVLTTKGARVRAGDVILELVPFGDQLIIEAKMNPSDVSFVKKGQDVAVKLDAYDYSIYGILHGKVSYISPDTLMEKTAQGEKPYFRVLVVLNQSQLISKSNKKIDIAPGMTAQVDIITGHRTVLDYLFKPIVKNFNNSFHER